MKINRYNSLNNAILISLKPLHFSCRIPATKIKHHENQYDILKSKKFIILLLPLIYHSDKVYPSAGRTDHHEGDALKNLALKKGSIQSRKLWGVVKLNGELGNSFAVKILDN
ncbi:hypothetical protein SH017_005164 [Escherichia coli]|nr:hypothetical protein [Escherichia coli]